MIEILRSAASMSVLVFAVTSMLSAGLSFTFRDIVAPLRRPNRVLRAAIANFVLVPLLAAGIARALSLDPAQSIALILLGTAAGAPFVIKLVAIAAGEVALATSLLVLLVPLTVVLMPIVVPLLAPEAAVSARAIAIPLTLTLILPLVLGLIIKDRAPRWTAILLPIARTASSITLVVLLVATTALNLRSVIDILASRAVVAVLLLVAGSFAIGYGVASPYRERRLVLGLGTAQRNIAAATVVAVEDIKNNDTLVLVVVASIIDLIVLIPLARWLRASRMEVANERQQEWREAGNGLAQTRASVPRREDRNDHHGLGARLS
ncbi:MAG TPA: bile acid:sodium symporter [Kofleriaceae bacterium]|nr:bile acid:sodium symporter [Kofleriaceae bacterium]